MIEAELCTFCDRPATTRDHVPPKRLFSPPLPTDLVTVPACTKCNNGASADDEVFRNELSILAGSFGESAKAAERLQSAMRSIRRNKAMLRRTVLGSKTIERWSPGGIFLGHGYAIPCTPGVQQRVNVRIVRGLYRHHFGARLDLGAQILLSFIDKRRPHWQQALNSLKRLQLKHAVVGDGGDEDDINARLGCAHTATAALMCGCAS